MSGSSLRRESIRFGIFEFDSRSGELRKHGSRLRLQGQPVEILTLLLSRAGELVTREELQKRLWASDTFVDFDRSLNAAVKRLRAALGDSAESPRYIETLARRGYRFVAPVDFPPAEEAPPAPAPSVEVPPAQLPAADPPRRRVAHWSWLAMPVVALGVLLFAGKLLLGPGRASKPNRMDSLLVLPFKNLSADPEQEFLADGITDALNARLAGISALRVISQTSSLLYRGTRKTLHQIGREANVSGIIEGSVLRSGADVRINVQLVDAADEKRVWGRTYERNVRDVLALQSEVTREIADEIRVKLTPGEQARLARTRAPDPEAHTAYVKGRVFWNKRTDEGLRTAIQYFEQAIERDPGYALAYVGLADSWVPRAWYAYLPPKDAFPQAKAAVTKALELDPDLAEAHTTLAFLHLYYDWDPAAAELEFLRAIELNPNYANAHHWYGEYLSLAGRHDAAIREAERARELDPLSSIISTWMGSRYFFARRYDAAVAQYRNTVELAPAFVPARFALGQAYEQKKMLPEAIAELETAVRLSGRSPVYLAALSHALGVAGRKTDALRILGELKTISRTRYVGGFDIALAWIGLGDHDRALDALERAADDRSPRLLFLPVEPRFDPLRSEARFLSLIARIGRPN